MRGDIVLRVIAKLLISFILVFGLYVQFHGDFGPGGGFQAGVIVAAAIIFHALPKESMNDLGWIVASVFGGCLVGLFMLGFFTVRVDNFSVIAGLVVATLFNIYLGLALLGWIPENLNPHIHAYWVGVLVNLLFVATAYGISLFRRHRREDLKDLTVWTL